MCLSSVAFSSADAPRIRDATAASASSNFACSICSPASSQALATASAARLGGETKTQWEIIESGLNTLGKITLSTLYTNQIGFMMGVPWLEDIAQLNVAHWQSDSDQRNLLHIARVPILFAKGFGDEDTQLELSIGSNSFLKGPSSADLKYVEHSGKGIEAGRNDLKDIEERIQFLGLEAMMKRPGGGDITATQSAIDSSESNSSLGMISQELENTLERMVVLARSRRLGLEDVPDEIQHWRVENGRSGCFGILGQQNIQAFPFRKHPLPRVA